MRSSESVVGSCFLVNDGGPDSAETVETDG